MVVPEVQAALGLELADWGLLWSGIALGVLACSIPAAARAMPELLARGTGGRRHRRTVFRPLAPTQPLSYLGRHQTQAKA